MTDMPMTQSAPAAGGIPGLDKLKALTTEQYDSARAKALERVQARIGAKPTRATFKRELGQIATPLDYLALIVFLAALIISSAHIIQYMKLQAAGSYNVPTDAGVFISLHAYTLAHEIGAILLAEAAAILFMTMHNINAPQRAKRRPIFRFFSIPLVLAITAATFVFVANASSGVNILVSLMPPLFTLGVGLRLEALIAETLRRREDITKRYLAALSVFEASSADPTRHPDFGAVLKQEIWAALMKLTTNKAFADASPSLKHAAVRRELHRETWAYEEPGEQMPMFQPAPYVVQSTATATGNLPAVPTGDYDLMPVQPRSNGSNGRRASVMTAPVETSAVGAFSGNGHSGNGSTPE